MEGLHTWEAVSSSLLPLTRKWCLQSMLINELAHHQKKIHHQTKTTSLVNFWRKKMISKNSVLSWGSQLCKLIWIAKNTNTETIEVHHQNMVSSRVVTRRCIGHGMVHSKLCTHCYKNLVRLINFLVIKFFRMEQKSTKSSVYRQRRRR